jgi:hypothetical protein
LLAVSFNQRVVGSIPTALTKQNKRLGDAGDRPDGGGLTGG